MTFDLIPWTDASRETPFDLDVSERSSYCAKITRSQVRRIAGATDLQAYVTDADSRSPVYALADGNLADWLKF